MPVAIANYLLSLSLCSPSPSALPLPLFFISLGLSIPLRADATAVRDESEKLLLNTYAVHLPPLKPARASDHPIDRVSVTILKKYLPVMLESHTPLDVIGDGNCMFRAASLGLYSNQEQHTLLRLLTAIEMLMNPNY